MDLKRAITAAKGFRAVITGIAMQFLSGIALFASSYLLFPRSNDFAISAQVI